MTDWIPWDGGRCPVNPRARVICRLGNGMVMKAAMAKGRDWKRYDGDMKHWQIVAYYEVPA